MRPSIERSQEAISLVNGPLTGICNQRSWPWTHHSWSYLFGGNFCLVSSVVMMYIVYHMFALLCHQIWVSVTKPTNIYLKRNKHAKPRNKRPHSIINGGKLQCKYTVENNTARFVKVCQGFDHGEYGGPETQHISKKLR